MVTPVAASEPVVLRARDLHKSFARGSETVHALRGAQLTVTAGEIVGVAGASGSGKSTMLAVLCGWEVPDSGQVEHPGGPVEGLAWSQLAIVPQTLGLLEDLTVEENIALPRRLSKRAAGRRDRTRASELMDRLGLTHLAQRRPSAVSVGEQQRTAIARGLLLRPGLLLADEPTAHQDHGWAAVVLATLREHADAGAAFILVSHDKQALNSTDRVLIMTDGVLA